MTSSETRTPGDANLQRGTLGFSEVLITGLSQIAPAFSVMFTAALIAGHVGSAVPIVYLLAMIGIGATGLSLAQFSRLWPSSGSFVTYISRAIHPRVGLTVAVIALVGYIVGNGGVYVYVGSYIVTEILKTDGTALTLVVTAIYATLVAMPVVLGVRVGVRAAILMYVLEVTVIAVFTFAILVVGGDHGLSTEPLSVNVDSAKGIGLGLSLAVLAFAGFEAPAALGEESSSPRRTVPLAILTGVLITGALYFVSSYAVVSAFPDAKTLASDGAPFVTASQRFVSPLADVVTWLFVTSVTGSFLGANIQLARVIFSGAREGLWSRRLQALHPRFQTPWLAVIACVGGSAAVGIGTALVSSVSTASGFVPSLGILGVVTMFVMTNVALIVHWWRERRRGVRRPVITGLVTPAIGAVVLAIPYWATFQPGQPAPYSRLPYFFVGLILLGVGYTAYLQARRPDLVAQAGSVILGERPAEGPGDGPALPTEDLVGARALP